MMVKTRNWNWAWKCYTSKQYPDEKQPWFYIKMQIKNLWLQIKKQYWNLIDKPFT